MTNRRTFFGTIAALASLAATGGLVSTAAAAPIEMQSEPSPRGEVLRRGSRGYHRRRMRARRAQRRYWRRRAYRRRYYY